MLKSILRIGGVVLVGVLVVGAVLWTLPGTAQAAYGGRQGANRGPVAPKPVSPEPIPADLNPKVLSEQEADALFMALNDEYKAWAVYEQVIADFGAVRPFTSIQKAEENHIAALVTLFDGYGLEVPENEWPGSIASFSTLAEACQAGVQAEIDNAALYDELMGMVDSPDITQVLTSLQQASQGKHLPAFERCAP